MPKVNCLTLVTGAVKSGKTLFSLQLVKKQLKRNRFRYKLKKFFFPKKFKNLEFPLLYSNIPLNCEYVPLTKELLTREKRFNYGSVIFVDEASLVADSQLIKDIDLNNAMLLFNKLIGHELCSGNIVYNTQSIQDLHYSIKRCISNYFYIHHTLNLFFFGVAYVREFIYSEDNTFNAVNEDLELSLRKVFISRKTAKLYDKYAFSTFTDNKEVVNKTIKPKKLKADYVVSFRDWSKYVNK